MKRMKIILEELEKKEISATMFLTVFLSIIALRLFIEQFIARSVPLNFSEVVMEYVHNIYFFPFQLSLYGYS